MRVIKHYLYALLAVLSLMNVANASVNPEDLLPPEQAFQPTVQTDSNGMTVDFNIADGYYLYQSKIEAQTSTPDLLKSAPTFSEGKEKEDEFFGKQIVYYQHAQAKWDYAQTNPQPYKLTLVYQGCADVGVCYPPVETVLDISGSGVFGNTPVGNNVFLKKPQDAAKNNSVVPPSSASANFSGSSQFKLSWDTLGVNLLAFFLAGLGLSFTACMYPLLPIVSSIIVGDKSGSKQRAFVLSMIYVQGLAVTYTLVGVLAGLTGALLTVWLQQAWVVLAASVMMVVLALSMFGVFTIQLPSALQSYFQTQSNRLSGGKMASVFGMGMLSALIVGPCVAPPLAFALGYIGQTGDATLGGLALYTLAIGTGVPLILIGTFGGHILPRAGNWMNGIKYAFGVILLAVAVYLAAGFLPYAVSASLYTALLIVPALYLLYALKQERSGSLKAFAGTFAALLVMGGVWFGVQSVRQQETTLHRFLTLYPPFQSQHHKFTDVAALKAHIQAAFVENPQQPVLLDFYADWCVSCKEMEARTFNQSSVQAAVPMNRLVQIDVTANTPEHQALLKEYGLYGPPGLFVLKADGSRSAGLLGFVPADEFIEWYQQQIR